MNSQRNSQGNQNLDTLQQYRKSGKTPSPSRRKRIFAEDQSQALISKVRTQEHAEKNIIVDEIYKTIENINWKLEDFTNLQHQNKALRAENSKLRSLIDENAEINILKKQKTELQSKLFDYKKRLEKAKLMVQVLFSEQKDKNRKELLQFQHIFDV